MSNTLVKYSEQPSMTFSSSPICLLEQSYEGQWSITSKAKQILQSLSGVQLKVISIVGACRSGKSFLLNELFLNERELDEKFKVTDGIEPCTKGLWMQICQHKEENQTIYIVVDSQGDGIGLNTNFMSAILTALCVGISQLVLWNSISTITHTGINYLGEIAKKIGQGKIIEEEDKNDKDLHGLIWVIRDNCLEVSDKEGKEITDQEYLERCLEDRKMQQGQMNSHRTVRDYLKLYFSQRDCVKLVRAINEDLQKQPYQQEFKLNNNGEVDKSNSNSNIREEFVLELAQLRKKIENQLKKLGSYSNGNDIVQEIECLIKIFSQNRDSQTVSERIGHLENELININKTTVSKGNFMVLLEPQGQGSDDDDRLDSGCDIISPFMEQYQLSRRNKKMRIAGELMSNEDLSSDSLEMISNDEEGQDSSDLESLSSQEIMTPVNQIGMKQQYSSKVSILPVGLDQDNKYLSIASNRICEVKKIHDINETEIGYVDTQQNGSIDSYLHTISELSAICEELSTSMSESKQRETQMLMQLQELQQICLQTQQQKIEQQKIFEEEKNEMIKKFEVERLAQIDGFERLKEKIVKENEDKMNNKVLEIQLLEEGFREKIARMIQTSEEEKMQERSVIENQVDFLRNQLQQAKIANQQIMDKLAKDKYASSCELQKQQSYNSELMGMISIQDSKILAMQSKIDTLKQFKKIVKSSAGFVCAQCGLYCETNNFHNHILVCNIKHLDIEILGRSYSGQRQVQSVKSGRRSGSVSDAMMEGSFKNKKNIIENERLIPKDSNKRNQFNIEIESVSYLNKNKQYLGQQLQQQQQQQKIKYSNGYSNIDDGVLLRGAKSCKNSSSTYNRASNSLYEIYASTENKNNNVQNQSRAFKNSSCNSYIDQLTRPSTASCVFTDESNDKLKLNCIGKQQIVVSQIRSQLGSDREVCNGDSSNNNIEKKEEQKDVDEKEIKGSQNEQSQNVLIKDKEEGKELNKVIPVNNVINSAVNNDNQLPYQYCNGSIDTMIGQQKRRNSTVDVPAKHIKYQLNYPSYHCNTVKSKDLSNERLNQSINDILQIRSADLSNQTFSPVPSRQQHSQSTITNEEGYLQENNIFTRSSNEWNMSKGQQGSYKEKMSYQRQGRISNKENDSYGMFKSSNDKQMKTLQKNLLITCNVNNINCHGNKEDIGKQQLSNKNSASTCKSLKTEINERLRKKTGKSPVIRQSIMQKK